MRWFFKTLRWLPGGVAALIWAAAQIGPKEAASNVSEWLSFIGISHLPQWLLNKSADRWAVWIGAIGFVLWLLAIFIWHFLPKSKEEQQQLDVKRPHLDILFYQLTLPFEEGGPQNPLWPNLPNDPDVTIFRVKIFNPNTTTIRKAFIKLLLIQQDYTTIYSQPDRLRFKSDETESVGYVDLNPGDGAIVCLFRFERYVNNNASRFFFYFPKHDMGIKPGKYILTLNAYGEDMQPTTKKFLIDEVNGVPSMHMVDS